MAVCRKPGLRTALEEGRGGRKGKKCNVPDTHLPNPGDEPPPDPHWPHLPLASPMHTVWQAGVPYREPPGSWLCTRYTGRWTGYLMWKGGEDRAHTPAQARSRGGRKQEQQQRRGRGNISVGASTEEGPMHHDVEASMKVACC